MDLGYPLGYNSQTGVSVGSPTGAVAPTSTYQDTTTASLNQDPNATMYQSPVQLGTSEVQWGPGNAEYDRLTNLYGEQKQGIYGSARDATANTGIGLNSSILDYLDSARLGQQGLDTKRARNELAKTQAYQGILGMVGRGIRSGGVTLANRNAGDSSATGAIASAYGDMGRRQSATVGNEYAQNAEGFNLEQQTFDAQRQSGARKIRESKQMAVNNIVGSAQEKLAALDADMASASLPDRINIEAEKNAIRQQTLEALAQYDQQLTAGDAGIQAMTPEQYRARASELGAMGTDLGKDAFNFTDQVPAQFQNTGPFSSSLPLFLQPKRRGE